MVIHRIQKSSKSSHSIRLHVIKILLVSFSFIFVFPIVIILSLTHSRILLVNHKFVQIERYENEREVLLFILSQVFK
jgi:hypothetical protein